ncbi:MAG: hypothetical protein HY912_20800 [Desulfomonile tiedjei]|uniref:Uncharacterized protein n=1 Tax=Desulfomonile tiedjei TaxID=2358 RepID=A0A9D6Z5C2_9BACT|nr:hypothetical protein [Desulfomonile tiedjei]
MRAVREAFHKSGFNDCENSFLSDRRLSAAAATAEEWFRRGIKVILPANLKSGEATTVDLPAVFFVRGNTSILERPTAAILNSRGKLTLSPDDQWLAATKEAFQYAVAKGLVLVSGYGNIQYSTTCALARRGPMVVVCHELLPFMVPDPAQTELASFSEEFFRSDKILFLSAFPPGPATGPNTRRTERDRLISEIASVLLVGRVRKGGNMGRILRQAEVKGKKTVHFGGQEEGLERSTEKVEHGASESVPGCRASLVQERPLKHAIRQFEGFADGSRFLIHYTRSFPGPWPGQNMLDYCLSLIDGEKDSTHTAFDTLMRIVKERRIRASAKLIRGKYPVVSLTECPPGEVRNLNEWRPGLIRWSFEPYGVALPLRPLFCMGARPVIYAVKEAYEDLSDELRYLFQLQSAYGRGWSLEKEWRIRGDLEITESLQREMVIIVKTIEEAVAVWETCRIPTALAGA